MSVSSDAGPRKISKSSESRVMLRPWGMRGSGIKVGNLGDSRILLYSSPQREILAE